MAHRIAVGRSVVGLRVVVALALLSSVVACASPAGGGHRAASGPTSVASSTVSPDEALIARARTQGAQYDYEAALATLASASTEAAGSELERVRQAKAAAVVWKDNTAISHLFYHSLVVDPKRAFTAGRQGAGFSQYMVTVSEFTDQLRQIYAKGYVLVRPQDIAAPGEDGVLRRRPIVLAPGKQPLVLSVDDVSYYEYMEGKGFATNLVKAADGRVVNTYVDAAGKSTQGNFDVMPIVDDFVRQHPDFSYRGAKGVLGLTGYNGILGYRTSVRGYGDTAATRSEQGKAKAVATAMKANGWQFASHSWGHINVTESTVKRIQADAQRWDREVRPLVGATPLLIYPFGADISGVAKYSDGNPKFTFLHDTEGFHYFFNIDTSRPSWMQIDGQSLRQARINVDGITLQRALNKRSTVLDLFFDARSTIDPLRPLPVPGSGRGPVPGVG